MKVIEKNPDNDTIQMKFYTMQMEKSNFATFNVPYHFDLKSMVTGFLFCICGHFHLSS